jgi:hypothetical protein
MQFIDVTDIEVRAAVYQLSRAGSDLKFLLFPMVHVGSATYYATVERMLAGCDLILLEGVSGGASTSLMMAAYRLAAGGPRLRLATQAQMNLAPVRDRIIFADMSAEGFAAGWHSIALHRRVLFFSLVPIVFLGIRIFGTRQALAEQLQIEDLPSRVEIMSGDTTKDFDELIVTERDQVITAQIEQLCNERQAENLTVAVVYGAYHMRAIVPLLLGKLKYRIVKSEWVQVFEL